MKAWDLKPFHFYGFYCWTPSTLPKCCGTKSSRSNIELVQIIHCGQDLAFLELYQNIKKNILNVWLIYKATLS